MSIRFEIKDTPLPDLKVLLRKPIGDSRGYLERLFCVEELNVLIKNRMIRQINHTLTQHKGSVRGLHFQNPPHAEFKLVTCLRGEVFDVAVDLRPESPTFLKWHAEYLSDNNWKTLAIPEGFAHGFQTITDNCELLYFHTASYHAEAEAGLNALDEHLDIAWPLPITERSTRDQDHPMIDSMFKGVTP
jgi:dTDP-4-dehydrorhamnose 3,5-epimerase